MKLLQKGLMDRPISVATVAGTLTEAGEVMERIRRLAPVTDTVSFGGFSQALADRSFDPLLAQP